MNCIYRYKNHNFNSEAELDDFLIEKFGYESKFGDLIFNKKTNFLRTKDIIENLIMRDSAEKELLMKIRNARLRASYYDEEEILNFDPPYIGVNKFLTLARKGNGDRLFPEFIVENYWNNRKEKWQKPLKPDETILDRFTDDEIDIFFEGEAGKTYPNKEELFRAKLNNAYLLNDTEAEQLIKLMTKKWEFQAAAGTAVHYVLLKYFTKDGDNILGDLPQNDIIDKILQDIDKDLSEQMGSSKYAQYKDSIINPDIIKQAVIYADELKRRLRLKHGNNCEFYPELSVCNKLNMASVPDGTPETLLGIIDLLVIDDRGQAHLYDYKTSPKPYDKFNNAKKRAYQYQLAMYGKLLKRYGLNYRDSDISILPIQFLDLELDNPEEAHVNPNRAKFSYSGIKPYNDIFDPDTKNKIFEVGPTGEEKILEVLDEFLPEETTYDVPSEELISNVLKTEQKWFPDYTKYKAKSDEEIKEMLEREGAFQSTEREGKQVYTYLPKGAYSREIVANSQEELVLKVKKQLEKIEKRSEYFANTVEKAIKHCNEHTSADISELVASIDTKLLSDPSGFAKWFVEKLGVYCNGNWKTVEIQPLKSLGIVALQNTKTQQIDLIKLTASDPLYNPFETEKRNGKRIKRRNHLLSYAFLSDINEISNSKSLMLDGYKGNIELMEVTLALNNIPSLFDGKTVIGNIQVINPFLGTGISASNELILYSFLKMSLLSPIKTNNIKDGKIKLGSTFDIAVNSFNEAMESSAEFEINNSLFNSAKSELDKAILDGDREDKIKAIQAIRKKLEGAHRDLKDKLTREMLLTKPYARLYNELLQAERYLHGINFKQQIKDHDKWTEEKTFGGILKNGLAGTMTDNPGNMLSDTLNTVAKLVTQAYQNIRNRMGSKVSQIRNATEELKKYKQYTGITQFTGNATDMYVNMTEEVNGDLLFTDLKSSKLSDPERKYLKLILEIINENRFGGKKSKTELEHMRDTHDLEYYRVPLCVATAESQDSIIGLQNGLKERLAKFHPKTAMADIRAKVDGLFMEEDADTYNDSSALFLMNNRFDKSESSIEYRRDAIVKHGAGYFERNLEVLAFKHCYSYISANELNGVFPIIKSAMGFLVNAGNAVNKDFEHDTEYLEGYVRNSIKGQPLEKNEKLRLTTAVLGKIKQIASFMALAFSPVQGLYQGIQGIWQDISLVIRKPDDSPAFTLANMWDAFKTVYKDMIHFSDKPTKCQLINEWLGVNDMDMNIYAERMRTDLHNKYNLVNFAYKFASRPDFYNRMTIIVAKMKADGIWDALEVKDNLLVYNWKKDKRFKAYANNKTSDPNYNNLKALYYTIAQQFVTEGTKYPNGDSFVMSKDLNHPTPLPYAWTNQEAESIKSLCDLIYGYYSHEKKSLIHATFLGSLYMQMKTYWSGKKNQYLQPGGVRLRGAWEQGIDPESGQPLYYQVNSKGEIDFDAPLTTTPTNAPFYLWKGKYQEGIIMTLATIGSHGILSKEGLKQGWNETFNNEDINVRMARRANLKLFASDIAFYLLIGMLIAGWLMADWDKELQKEAKESGELSDALKATLLHATRLSFGQSAEDFNWWVSIGNPAVNWSPFSITLATNMSKRYWNGLFGDTDFYDAITKSFATGKQMGPLVDWLDPKNFIG